MQSTMLKAIVEDFGNGGTIDGDLVVSGDLQVSGGGSLSFDEIVQGTQVVEITNTEAFLVRKASDGGDVFIVDTTNSRVGIGATPTAPLHVATSGSQLNVILSSASQASTIFNNANAVFGILDGSTELMRLNSTGLGIGVTPTSVLHLKQANDGATTEIAIDNSASGGSTDELVGIRFRHNGGTSAGILSGRDEDFSSSANRSGNLIFRTNKDDSYSEKMRLTSGGNLGIGVTPNADTPLHIFTNSSSTQTIFFDNDGTGRMDFVMRNDRSTEGSASHSIFFDGADASGNNARYATIENHIVDNADASEDGKLVFSTMVAGTDTETLNITGGNVGIGTTPESALHINTSSSGGIGGKLIIDNQASDADGNGTEISFFNASGASASGVANSRIRSVANGNTNGYSELQFWTYHASEGQRMTLTSDGNLGIGSSSPISNVEIKGTISSLDGVPSGLVVHDSGTANSGLQLINNSGKFAIHADGANDRVDFYLDDATTGSSFAGSDKLLTLKYGGNVGIGSDSPNQFVEIKRASRTTTFDASNSDTWVDVLVRNPQTTENSATGIAFQLNSTYHTNASTGICAVHQDADYEADMVFITRGHDVVASEKMRLTSGGSLGIGTSSPSNLASHGLQIQNTTTSSSTEGGEVKLTSNDGSALESGHRLGGVMFSAYEDSGSTQINGAAIEAFAESNWTSSNNSTFLSFKTNESDNSYLERMRIDSAGDLQLQERLTFSGTNNTVSSASINLHSNGYLYIAGGSSGVIIGDDSSASRMQILDNSDVQFEVAGTVRFKMQTTSRISLSNNDNNTDNTVFGKSAFNASSDNDSDRNLAIGNLAMGTGTVSGAQNNTAIGHQALTDITSADRNVAIGASVAPNITTGERNTVIGADALGLSTTGLRNVAIGNLAMYASPASVAVADCVAIGYYALGDGTHTTGANYSVAIGSESMKNATEGGSNVACGYQSGKALTTGDQNVMLGSQAMANGIVTGDNNVAIGAGAGYNMTSGHSNVIIGKDTNPSANTGQNQIVIGHSATGQADNSVTLGNSDVTNIYLAPGNTSGQTIFFNDASQAGWIQYDHSDDQMKLAVANTINARLYNGRLEPGSDDTQDLGSTTRAWHTLYVKDGINFPDDASANPSSDANTLDNYEEGTYTPVVSNGSTNYSASVENGYYTKIGDQVFVQVNITSSEAGSGGALQVTLPFNYNGAGNKFITASVRYGGLDLDANCVQLMLGNSSSGTSNLLFFSQQRDDNTQLNLSADAYSSGDTFQFNVHYKVA